MRANDLSRSSRPGAIACPVCGKAITRDIRGLASRIEPSAAHRLQRENPGWSRNAGACPECVFRAASAARMERSPTSLQEELLFPYPVYAPDEIRLLSATQRVNANPQYTGKGVTMAFLDSGFYPHADLTWPNNRILEYIDATGERPVQKVKFNRPQVTSWHGLMTSCVAAGNGKMSGRVYRGIAHQANLVLVKTGNPAGRGIREVDIQRALAWVIDNHERYAIRVVNISLGGDHPANGKLTELDRAVEEATRCGITVVTAAGNEGTNRLLPPASAPSAITVGGLDDRNTYDSHFWNMYHSNYGRSLTWRPKPEIIAPARWLAAPMLPGTREYREGVALWQLDQGISRLRRLLKANGGSHFTCAHEEAHGRIATMQHAIRKRMIEKKFIHAHYQHVDGTSMAAPLVSSTVAQMLETNPGLTSVQVKEILVSTATPLENFPIEQTGAGLLNSGWAVAVARRRATGAMGRLAFSPHIEKDKITFSYFSPENQAGQVALIGSFNDWNPQGYAFQCLGPGIWQLSIPALPPGSYRYKFLVEKTWINDPENPNRVEDGFGGFSSILEVAR